MSPSAIYSAVFVVAGRGVELLRPAFRRVGGHLRGNSRARWVGGSLVVATFATASAQVVTNTLVKDIHTGASNITNPDSSPVILASRDGVVYIVAFRPDVGFELWRTDGTPGGTSLVADLEPGPLWSSPSNMTELVDGRFVFTAFTSQAGKEVFVTDGTPSGTGLIHDIVPGPESSDPRSLVAYHGNVYFIANDGVHGEELWVTDGTSAGTHLVVDRTPGIGSGMGKGALMVEGGHLLGVAASQSGPTQTTLVELTNVFPPKLKDVQVFAGLLPDVFFKSHATAGDAAIFMKGSEVWRSDGTTPGTFQIASTASPNMWIVGSQGKAYFGGLLPGVGSELMVTDGSASPPRLVVDLAPGTYHGVSAGPAAAPYRSGILFRGSGGLASGTELYYSDGTKLGTKPVTNLFPGPNSSNPTPLIEWHDDFYFLAAAPGIGEELFKVDPSLSVVTLVADLYPGVGGGGYWPTFAGAAGALVFTYAGEHGREPWATRGTAKTTKELVDLNPSVVGESSNLSDLTRVGNSVFFVANDGIHGRELWRTDGTEVGTQLWIDLVPGSAGSDPTGLVAMGGSLYFAAEVPGAGVELVRTDETSQGIYDVLDLAGPLSSFPRYLTPVGDRLFFAAWDSVSVGRELFMTDGTMAGTSLVADLSTKLVTDSYAIEPPFYLFPFGDKVFFFHDGLKGNEPWISDGTASGTFLLRDIKLGPSSSMPAPFTVEQSIDIVELNGEVFFSADATGLGAELWKSDGTLLGTVIVTDINPGPMGSNPKQFQRVDDRLLFVATSALTGQEVWQTDGTAAGTSVVDVVPGPASSNPTRLQSIGDRALFTTQKNLANGMVETQLLLTDGYTVLLATSLGVSSSSFASLANPIQWLGNGEYGLIVNQDTASGAEYWVTDGSASKTTVLTDSATGWQSSSPGVGVQLGSKFLFPALDYTHGRELHAFDLVDTAAWVAKPVGHGCVGVGGEFTISPLGAAVIGSPFGVALAGAPPSSPTLLFASGGLVGPAPMSACILGLVDPIVLASFSSTANGTLSVMAPLPPNPSLIGSLFYLQMAAPLTHGPFQGIATFSAPLEVVVNS